MNENKTLIPWFLLVIATFGIAYIYVLPYYQATITNAYNALKSDKQSEQPALLQ